MNSDPNALKTSLSPLSDICAGKMAEPPVRVPEKAPVIEGPNWDQFQKWFNANVALHDPHAVAWAAFQHGQATPPPREMQVYQDWAARNCPPELKDTPAYEYGLLAFHHGKNTGDGDAVASIQNAVAACRGTGVRLLGVGKPIESHEEIKAALDQYPALGVFVERCSRWVRSGGDPASLEERQCSQETDAQATCESSSKGPAPRQTTPLCILIQDPNSQYALVIQEAAEARGKIGRCVIWLRPPTTEEFEIVKECSRAAEGIGDLPASTDATLPDVLRSLQVDFQDRRRTMTRRYNPVKADNIYGVGAYHPGSTGGQELCSYVLLKIPFNVQMSERDIAEWLKLAINEFERHAGPANTVVAGLAGKRTTTDQEDALAFAAAGLQVAGTLGAGVANGRRDIFAGGRKVTGVDWGKDETTYSGGTVHAAKAAEAAAVQAGFQQSQEARTAAPADVPDVISETATTTKDGDWRYFLGSYELDGHKFSCRCVARSMEEAKRVFFSWHIGAGLDGELLTTDPIRVPMPGEKGFEHWITFVAWIGISSKQLTVDALADTGLIHELMHIHSNIGTVRVSGGILTSYVLLCRTLGLLENEVPPTLKNLGASES